MWMAQPLSTARATRFTAEVTNPIAGWHLAIKTCNKWLGSCEQLAVRMPRANLLVPARSLSFSTEYKSIETLVFPSLLASLLAMVINDSETLVPCFRLGGAHGRKGADRPGTHGVLGFSMSFLHDMLWLFTGPHVDCTYVVPTVCYTHLSDPKMAPVPFCCKPWCWILRFWLRTCGLVRSTTDESSEVSGTRWWTTNIYEFDHQQVSSCAAKEEV